jgi:hypothetical protein
MEPYKSTQNRMTLQESTNSSQEVDGVDYLTLGYVRVPLLHLITKNSGIDGEFIILDDFK